MKIQRLLIICLIFFTSVFITGCLEVNNDFISLRHDIIKSTGESFNPGIEFALDAVGLSAARIFVKMDTAHHSDVDLDKMLNCISKVQVGVYDRNTNSNTHASFAIVKKIDEQMYEQGYQYIVKSCHHGEVATVYVRLNPGGILTDMYVVSLEPDELVIVQLSGNLDKLMESIIHDKGFDFDFAANR